MNTTVVPPDFDALIAEMKDSVLFTDDPISVFMQNSLGEMPIHVFAVRGDVEHVLACVAKGVDIDAPGEDGFTALHEAAMHGHPELVKALLDAGANCTIRNDWRDTPYETAKSLEDRTEARVLEILGAANMRRTSI